MDDRMTTTVQSPFGPISLDIAPQPDKSIRFDFTLGGVSIHFCEGDSMDAMGVGGAPMAGSDAWGAARVVMLGVMQLLLADSSTPAIFLQALRRNDTRVRAMLSEGLTKYGER